jgi:hypothetical protein
VVGASCTLNISFKHTTGDYLDAELRTRKPQEPVKLTIDYTQLSSNRDIFHKNREISVLTMKKKQQG